MRWNSHDAYRTVPSPPSYGLVSVAESRRYSCSYCQNNVKGLRLLSAHFVCPKLEASLEPVLGTQFSSIKNVIILERLFDIAVPLVSGSQ